MMKFSQSTPPQNRGSTLVEAVIAMGVLSVAIPLVFGALAESGKSGMAAEAETRSAWIVPVCMEEIKASRLGLPRFFTPTTTAQPFPPSGDVWAIGFSADGKPVEKITKARYERGTKEISGQPIAYIATLNAVPLTLPPSTPPPASPSLLMSVRISLEYPSSLPANRRQKLEFYSRIP
jgi:hypothetical protein